MPSTRHSDSIRLDLPLGGWPRYGADAARSRATPVPVSKGTLSTESRCPNPSMQFLRRRGSDLRGVNPGRLDACSVDDQQMALPLALLEEDESTVHRRSGREGGHPIRHPLAVDANPATGQRPSCITPR